MLAAGAMALPFAAVITIGAGPASASKSNPTGTGNPTCTKVKGTIKFSPPLTNSGTAAETATIAASATKCKGGTPNPTKVSTSATITGGTSACSSLATAAPPTLTELYTPNTISPSAINGGVETSTTSPHIAFTITGETTTGSFANAGGTSVNAATKETSAQFSAACSSSKGLAELKITSGKVTAL
jgi:hypothetical protein